MIDPVGRVALFTGCGLVVDEPPANPVSILVCLATPAPFHGVWFVEVLLFNKLFYSLPVVAGFP